MNRSEKLFQEIEDLEKKSQILRRFTAEKLSLTVRAKNRVEFEARAEVWNPPFRLQIKPIQDVRLGIETVTVRFDFLGERYFSRTELGFDDWKLFLIFLNPLYRLQQRQHRRFKIPRLMKNQAFLMRANETVWNEQCELIDLSQGGCSLRLSHKALEISQQSVVLLDLKLGDFDSFIQMGYVRYIKAEKHNGRQVVRMGIEFHHRKSIEPVLNHVLEHLTTEIFNSWVAHP
ncbi:MAG: PilZ domain-containing protein [Bdellovibrionales bacterium]